MHNPYLLYIEEKFKNNFDFHIKTLKLEPGCVYILFINTICDEKIISKCIIEPMLETHNQTTNIDVFKNEIITVNIVEEAKDEEDAIKQLLNGKAVLIFEFSRRVIWCDVRKFAHRAIDVPPTEAVLRGPREGFTENLLVNISLVRKHLKDPHLKCESMLIGERADTEVVIVYVDNVSPATLVAYIKKEVGKIKKGYVHQSNFISEQLATRKTAFDTIAYTEKPDVFCAKISEGKVGIIVQGDATAVTAPCFLFEKFQSASDYTALKYVANFTRLIRWFSFTVAMLIPGLYIALASHHFGLIPRMLAFRLSISRAGVPYPIFVEYFLMTMFFQILREGGIRLPQPIGQAISIVGALILGDAAVQSGLASSITVLIVALTSIATFLVPAIAEAVVMWSSLLVICATLMGLPGYYIGFAVFCSHLGGITTCGYPYLYPLGTMKRFGFKDHFIRSELNDISNNIFQEEQKNEK